MTRDERIETAARTLRAIFAVGSPELDDREVAVAVVNAAYPELRPWLRESLDRRARRLKQEEAE